MITPVTPEQLLYDAIIVAHEKLKARHKAYYACGPLSTLPMSPREAYAECALEIQAALAIYGRPKHQCFFFLVDNRPLCEVLR